MFRRYTTTVQIPVVSLLLILNFCGNGVSAQTATSATSRNGIRQVHVVAYHGASYPLKDLHPDETTELTATGEKQMYNLGVWLQERYGGYLKDTNRDPSLIHIESSTHNRAVTSGMAIALGLFNASSRDVHSESQLPKTIPRPNIPIYTPHYDKINDVTFRAYDTCTSYQSKLSNMFTTATTTNPAIRDMMTNDSELHAILTKLAAVKVFQKYADTSSGMIRLQHLHDVVNVIAVSKLECTGHYTSSSHSSHNRTHACHQLPNVHATLTDSEWDKVQHLAYRIELVKYSSDNAGTHIGGFLLHTIIDRMMNAYQGTQDSETHMNVYTTTDTTIWGIAAALGEQDFLETAVTKTTSSSNSNHTTGTLLPYGSAFIFELHGTASSPLPNTQLIVDLYFKSGSSTNATLIGTICGPSQIMDHCPLISLTQYVNLNITKHQWCKDCANDSAEMCVREALMRVVKEGPTTSTTPPVSSNTSAAAVCSKPKMSTAGSMMLGIVIGFFLTMFGYCYYSCCRKKTTKSTVHRTATTSARANTSNMSNDNRTFDSEDDEEVDSIFS